jgi:hypothetical protein
VLGIAKGKSMPEKEKLQSIREELIGLLESDQWRMTDAAESDGRMALASVIKRPTQCDIIKFILELLKKGFPMHAVELGEPPGSMGTGYVMNNADGKDLYIKLAIDNEKVLILSVHPSKHKRKQNGK